MKLRFIGIMLAALAIASSAHAGDGAALDRYLPSSTQGVTTLNVEAMRSAGVLSTLLGAAQAQDSFTRVASGLERVSFNPETDLSTVMLVTTSMRRGEKPLLLVEGTIPRAEIEAAITGEGQATTETVGTATVHVTPRGTAICFLADNTVALGPADAVRQAAAIAGGTDDGGVSSRIRRQLRNVDRSEDLWFVGIPSASQTENTPAAGMEAFRGAVDLSSGMGLSVHMRMPSSESAASAAEGLVGYVSDLANNDQIAVLGIGSVLSSVAFAAAGEDVHMQWTVSRSTFERLLATVQMVLESER